MPFDDAGILESLLRTDREHMFSSDFFGWVTALFA